MEKTKDAETTYPILTEKATGKEVGVTTVDSQGMLAPKRVDTDQVQAKKATSFDEVSAEDNPNFFEVVKGSPFPLDSNLFTEKKSDGPSKIELLFQDSMMEDKIDSEKFQDFVEHMLAAVDPHILEHLNEARNGNQLFDEMPKLPYLVEILLAATMDGSNAFEWEVGDITTRVFDSGRKGRWCKVMAMLTMSSDGRNKGNSLVIHNKTGFLKGAHEQLEGMLELKCHYTVHSFITFLSVFVHSMQSNKAGMLLEKLPMIEGIKSDLNSCNLVIGTLCKLGLMDLALLVIGTKEKSALECDIAICQIVDEEGTWNFMERKGVVPNLSIIRELIHANEILVLLGEKMKEVEAANTQVTAKVLQNHVHHTSLVIAHFIEYATSMRNVAKAQAMSTMESMLPCQFTLLDPWGQ